MEEETKRGHGLNHSMPRLVFLGTPDFAVPSLQKLSLARAAIDLVITQPDRPKGRGRKVTAPPVKILAEELGLPVFQPDNIKADSALDTIRTLGSECAVVVAYGQILPQAFLDLFPLGALNVHASLLPKYRGAAPIQRSILAGDTKTGVTIMLLDTGMDTGPILAQREIAIEGEKTFGVLHDEIAQIGADLLCETLVQWRTGKIEAIPQDSSKASYAPPISKEELRISWDLPARRIVDQIRAFDPIPGAYAFYGGRRVKFFGATLAGLKVEARAGEICGQTSESLIICASDGRTFAVTAVQMEGQRRLPVVDFLRGYHMPLGTSFD